MENEKDTKKCRSMVSSDLPAKPVWRTHDKPKRNIRESRFKQDRIKKLNEASKQQ